MRMWSEPCAMRLQRFLVRDFRIRGTVMNVLMMLTFLSRTGDG